MRNSLDAAHFLNADQADQADEDGSEFGILCSFFFVAFRVVSVFRGCLLEIQTTNHTNHTNHHETRNRNRTKGEK
jgi:hypothetical protein